MEEVMNRWIDLKLKCWLQPYCLWVGLSVIMHSLCMCGLFGLSVVLFGCVDACIVCCLIVVQVYCGCLDEAVDLLLWLYVIIVCNMLWHVDCLRVDGVCVLLNAAELCWCGLAEVVQSRKQWYCWVFVLEWVDDTFVSVIEHVVVSKDRWNACSRMS